MIGYMSGLDKSARESLWDEIKHCDMAPDCRQILEAITTQDKATADLALKENKIPWDGKEFIHDAVIRLLLVEDAKSRCQAAMNQIGYQHVLDAGDMATSIRRLAATLTDAAAIVEQAKVRRVKKK